MTVWARQAALVAGLVVGALRGAEAQEEDAAGIALGQRPPAAFVSDLAGASVDLQALTGAKPTLIEFWATWCPRCAALEPRLDSAYARYGTEVQFLAIAVAVNETREAVRRHRASHPVPYRTLWDRDGAAVRAFQAPTTSFVVVLSRTGRVVYTGVGAAQQLEPVLRRVAGGG